MRFLPQLEALEPGRRRERVEALAQALGVPAALVNSYLEHIRAKEKADNLPDTGGELIYEAESVQKLADVAQRLGSTESERLRKLLEIRNKAQKAKAPPD